jgi:hypothetical protein
VVLQQWFLHNPITLIFFNSTLWIPQIIKNYRIKSRKGPQISLAVSLIMMQSFLPFYLKILPGNFLELPTDNLCAVAMLLLIVFQIIMLKSQQ